MKVKRSIWIAVWKVRILLLVVGFLVSDAWAETVRIQVNITYRISEGVYINAGTDQGISEGLTGTLVLKDGQTLVFEVGHAARKTALLRLRGGGENLVGSLQSVPVELVFDAEPSKTAPAGGAGVSSESKPFVPLLTPPKNAPEITPTKNITHGNVGLRQTYQGSSENQQEYAVTRLDSSGSIDRLFGSQWSFLWSGNLRYRTGDGYTDHPEYETIQPLIYSAYFQRALSGDGFSRLGRFVPLELPAVGYVDGVQAEIDSGTHWQFGAVAGLKPNRVNLEATADDPTATGYVTLETGNYGATYYSGTAGLLGALHKSEFDRLALLWDQRASLGPLFDLTSSMEFDFGVADTTNSQSQLTRFDLNLSSHIHSLLILRAGADHWQRLDSEAERDQLPFIINDELFDDGYWRYWVGARHELPWRLDLNEELAYTVSDAVDDAMRWRVGLTRTGLFGWNYANIGATLYNLEAQDMSGYGGLLRAYFPFWSSRLAIRPSVSMRWLDPDNGGEGLTVTYYSLYFDANITRSWTLSGGVSSTDTDTVDALLFDAGLRYNW